MFAVQAYENSVMRERDVFIEALDAQPADRAAVLEHACGGDAALRAQVEQLLAEHDRQESFFLDKPPADVDATLDFEQLAERPGARVGPYKLLQQIGEGGMGVVFMAEQAVPLRRTVAVKIIKPGMDSRQVIARFEAERQALALMEHPNIAKVLDAGTTLSGRPYFVMELVKGVPITQYCDEKHLPLRARLELLVPVCQAVQHAHQKGLIHRDIKPSNVLVAEYDDLPVPKVIDFGVAKATSQKLTERTMFTEFGQVIGTLEYMSPEQAKLNQLDIDTRSDIYSIGVLLYELLTGSTPFGHERLSTAAFDEVLRIIREEEPPKPSTRLSTTDRLPGVATCRALEPGKLSRLVKGELDWIVMKALEKDRNRRYETASAFAADVDRYLRNEPVIARGASTTYRLRKAVHRNRVVAIASMSVFVALIVGLTAATTGLLHARAQSAISRQTVSFLTEMLSGVGPAVAQGRDTTLLREILDKTAKRLDSGEFDDQPGVEVELRSVIGKVYVTVGDHAAAEAMLRRCLSLASNLYGQQHPQVGNVLSLLANVRRLQNDLTEAEALARQALAIQRSAYPRGHEATATTLLSLSDTLLYQGRNAESVQCIREAIDLRRQMLGPSSPEVAWAMLKLSNVLKNGGDLAAAEPLTVGAVRILEESPDQSRLDVAHARHDLARLKCAQGKHKESHQIFVEVLKTYREVYGPDHAQVVKALVDDADNHAALGDNEEAEALLREAVAIGDRGDRTDQTNTEARKLLAHFLLSQQRFEECERIFREGIAVTRRSNASHELGHNLVDLGKVLVDQQKYAEAEVVLREALAIREKHSPEGWWGTFDTMSTLGEAIAELDRYTEAEPLLIDGYEGITRDPLAWPLRRREALERIVALYEQWELAEPGQGRKAQALSWKKKREKSAVPAVRP